MHKQVNILRGTKLSQVYVVRLTILVQDGLSNTKVVA